MLLHLFILIFLLSSRHVHCCGVLSTYLYVYQIYRHILGSLISSCSTFRKGLSIRPVYHAGYKEGGLI